VAFYLTNISIDEKLKVSLAASFLLSLTLFFFGPALLYYTNILEMPFFISNIWHYILFTSLVVGFSLVILLWWLKGSYHTTVSTLIFALGLLFWIQGNILVWEYGLLDGHEIIWENYFWNGIIDSLVWISILFFAFRYSKRLYRHIAVLSALLLIMQTAGIMATASVAPEEPEWKNLQPSPDHAKMYEFSTNMNLIIIILDTFQSDIFQKIIDEDPEYADMFKGFTYYRNNVGGFPSTYLSVMYILSGKFYNNSIPIQQFIKDASLHDSLPVLLKENGVRTDVRAILQTIFPSHEIYDTIDGLSWKTNEEYSVRNISEITPLYRLTLFRFVPQALKRYFYVISIEQGVSEVQNPDMEVYKNFKSTVRVSAPEKIFKLFHLGGPHAPYNLNESLGYEEMPQSINGYMSQAKASLKITHALLESLKQKNSYNNSLIFIIGDHGTVSGTFSVSVGTPLMLGKPFNSAGPLKISDAPVTLGDIPKTVAEELKIKNNFHGSSIFSVHEIDSRLRYFYFYKWNNDNWSNQFLPPLREYSVSGFSWDSTSWEPTYRVYTSKGVEYIPPPLYAPGSIIHFGIGGNAEQCLTQGWSGPENGFRWTDGHTAVFTCTLPKPKNDLLLNVTFAPFLGADIKSQRLSIFMNGYKLQDVRLTNGWQNITMVIPHNYFEEEIQRITFDLPDAISPNDLGISTDGRKLGIAVRTLSLNDSKGVE
jgi:hypothetical protein